MEQTLAVVFFAVLLAWVVGLWYRRLRRWWRPRPPPPDVSDAAQQLTFVSRVTFERQPLLNKSEFQLLLLLEAVIRDMRAGHRVMAQANPHGQSVALAADMLAIAMAEIGSVAERRLRPAVVAVLEVFRHR